MAFRACGSVDGSRFCSAPLRDALCPGHDATSIPPAPPVTIALDVAGEILAVAEPRLVFVELDLFHGRIGTLALAGRLLHLGGKFLHEAEQIFHVLLGAEPT